MPPSLFESVHVLFEKLETENLDIHSTQETLAKIVSLGQESDKLRIVTHFLSILEALTRAYEYDQAQIIISIKTLIKEGLLLIVHMVDGSITNVVGAHDMETIIQKARVLLIQKLGSDPFIRDKKLVLQLAYNLEKDIDSINSLFETPILVKNTKQYYETTKYYLQKMKDNTSFLGAKDLESLIQRLISLIDVEFYNHSFAEIAQHKDFIQTLEYLKKFIHFTHQNIQDFSAITEYFINNPIPNFNFSISSDKPETSPVGTESLLKNDMTLSQEEISALMNDQYTLEEVSFDDFAGPEAIQPISNTKNINNFSIEEEYKQLTQKKIAQVEESSSMTQSFFTLQEDQLIRALGRLFQKQEIIKNSLTEEQKVQLSDDLQEEKNLNAQIKKILFDNYYISILKLLGKELRDYIHKEVKTLGKKIRLGVRGENSEILFRESAFIKELVFEFVKNSIHHSLEHTSRRKAIDKSESGWLLIEFESVADMFDIHIRDDGKGLNTETMNIAYWQETIVNKGGTLSIDSLENEYLKVHIQLPMKKILLDCLIVKIGAVSILIPDRCIYKVVDIKDIMQYQKKDNYLGQINLSILLEIEPSPVNMAVVCEFGQYIIIFGVEKILYHTEVIVEEFDISSMPGVDQVSILKDGNLGFILNEKKIFQLSKQLLAKRDKK